MSTQWLHARLQEVQSPTFQLLQQVISQVLSVNTFVIHKEMNNSSNQCHKYKNKDKDKHSDCMENK